MRLVAVFISMYAVKPRLFLYVQLPSSIMRPSLQLLHDLYDTVTYSAIYTLLSHLLIY